MTRPVAPVGATAPRAEIGAVYVTLTAPAADTAPPTAADGEQSAATAEASAVTATSPPNLLVIVGDWDKVKDQVTPFGDVTMYDALTSTYTLSCPTHGETRVRLAVAQGDGRERFEEGGDIPFARDGHDGFADLVVGGVEAVG